MPTVTQQPINIERTEALIKASAECCAQMKASTSECYKLIEESRRQIAIALRTLAYANEQLRPQ